MPASAITAPTDRSMPPVRITKVMPTAISALIETWRRMLLMLLADRKLSEANAITTETTISPTSG